MTLVHNQLIYKREIHLFASVPVHGIRFYEQEIPEVEL